MRNRLLNLFVMMITVTLLSGCEDEPVQRTVPQVSKSVVKAQNAPASATVEQDEGVEEKYIYNAFGKRDPFENPLQVLVDVASTDGVPLTPLQKFDLVQLRLIGVIVGKGNPRAMVVSPDGKSFILSVGTKIGKNNGVVNEITTEVVRVKEKYFDFAGDVKTSIQEIKLPKQGGVE